MSGFTDGGDGAVFQCDRRGRVQQVLSDDIGLLDDCGGGGLFFDLLEPSSKEKFSRFLDSVGRHGAALSWELNVQRGEDVEPMNFFGLLVEELVFCIVSRSPHNLFQLYDELMRMLNEQSEMLRASQQECRQLRNDDESRLAEFMRLNNELVNARRELTLKNMEVEARERMVRSIINASPDALFVVAADGGVRFSNPGGSDLLERSPDLGRRWLLLIRECKEEEQDICLLGEDDAHQTMEMRTSAIAWEGEDAYLVSLRDVSERRKLEMVREEMDRITRHDIKSPLSGIISLAGMYADDDSLDQDKRRALKMIETAGFRVLNMVNMSLDLYKMEEGNYHLERQEVDLAPLLRRVVEEKSSLVRMRELHVEVLLDGRPLVDGEPIVAMADETLCYSMIGNLVANAVEASPKKGRIGIDLQRTGEELRIRIANSGAVPEDIRDRFFDKYVTSGKRGGTGIGTYSAWLIARTLGGSIRMETDEESGTVVTVRLPV